LRARPPRPIVALLQVAALDLPPIGQWQRHLEGTVSVSVCHSTAQPAQGAQDIGLFQSNRYHRWMSWLSVGLYNFCRPHSSLKIRQETQVMHRNPAMVAGLADHIWSTCEWLLRPVLGGQR
jgi:hypothetical protein